MNRGIFIVTTGTGTHGDSSQQYGSTCKIYGLLDSGLRVMEGEGQNRGKRGLRCCGQQAAGNDVGGKAGDV